MGGRGEGEGGGEEVEGGEEEDGKEDVGMVMGEEVERVGRSHRLLSACLVMKD